MVLDVGYYTAWGLVYDKKSNHIVSYEAFSLFDEWEEDEEALPLRYEIYVQHSGQKKYDTAEDIINRIKVKDE